VQREKEINAEAEADEGPILRGQGAAQDERSEPRRALDVVDRGGEGNMKTSLLILCALLASGCSPFFGPADLTMPPPEALSAAVVASYPFVARACLTLAPPVKRPLCIAGAREALGQALEVHDAAFDAQLAAPAGAGERAVTR
jgi:hypothetical protein